MTGRRLYDHYTDALAKNDNGWERRNSVLPHFDEKPTAWPFLGARDRRVWNELARRITPRKAARS